jgi:uncharacterized membrane protein YdjX (TVP38/TMEM64 family)
VAAFVARGAEAARSAGPLGAVAVFAALVGATLLLVPMIPLVMACGWIYGMAGALLSLPAVVASAAIGFGVGRALGRRRFARALATRPRLRALAELAERGGILTVALLRVSPLLPFTPSNAVLGMTSLQPRHLVAGTFFGILPGGLLYTAAGALLPDAAALQRGETPRAIFWATLALGAVSMGVIGAAAARKLRDSPATRI